MPPRITRKSTRPRVSDRTMVATEQPYCLSVSGVARRSCCQDSEPVKWNTPAIAGTTPEKPLIGEVAGNGGPDPQLRRREKNVLDFPFYRTGLHVHYKFCTGSEADRNLKCTWRDFTPSMKSSVPSIEKLDTLFLLGWKGCQGRPRAFISTLDSPPNHTMERGTKRNEVQWSFVP